jgi:hypothetical protein
MLYLCTKFHMLSPSDSFVIIFKPEAKNFTARHIVFILHFDFITSNDL